MSKLIYIILLAYACCVVMSACGRIDDTDSNTETSTLYGLTEENQYCKYCEEKLYKYF